MPELAIRLTLRSPAAIGELRSAGFVTRTLRYVPGSVVRGALARTWLIDRDLDAPADRRRFLDLFEGDVSFGPLHRSGSLPDPLSLLTHKYPARPTCPLSFDAFTHQDPCCPTCQGLLEPGKGAIRGVQATMETHAQLPLTPGEDKTQPFARERLDRGQVFVGLIGAPDQAALDDIRRLLGDGLEVWVGGRKSSGGGRALIEVADMPRPLRLASGNDRIDVLLTSPGIFVDSYGMPCDTPSADELRQLLGRTARIEHRLVRWTTVGGWHAASKLPKPVERAIAPGSVYRIQTTGPVDPAALAAVQSRGLGLRRAEGFGAVSAVPGARGSAGSLVSVVAPLAILRTSPNLIPPLLADLSSRRSDMTAWRQPKAGFADRFIANAPAQFKAAQEALRRILLLDAEQFGAALAHLQTDLAGGSR